MARASKIGELNHKGRGRPKGTKNIVPPSFKASLKKIFKDIATEDPAMLRKALEDGLSAKPPYSFQYLQLAAHYIDGKPSDKVEHDGNVTITWKTDES